MPLYKFTLCLIFMHSEFPCQKDQIQVWESIPEPKVCLSVCFITVFKVFIGDIVPPYTPCQPSPNILDFLSYSLSPFLLACLCSLFGLTTGFMSKEFLKLASVFDPPCVHTPPLTLTSHPFDLFHSLLYKILKIVFL